MIKESINKTCIIVGASHAGVNCAFALRRNGWQGKIKLYDADPELPYHRPPLSKAYITASENADVDLLFPKQNYETEKISLNLGVKVTSIDKVLKTITLEDESKVQYDKLVLATGAKPFIPPIKGIENALDLYPMRNFTDAIHIKNALNASVEKNVVIIGGGYIGLETAASSRKMGANVTVLERESRVLERVTAPEMSAFFTELHQKNGVKILTNKNVVKFEADATKNIILCEDGTSYSADLIVVGVGIKVNTDLAQNIGLELENGIKVDQNSRTSDTNIYAIGDCTYHFNPHYKRFLRLESVQNAVDQAKIAASSICGNDLIYDAIPWFWSDQYNVKLQMVGLSQGYNQIIKRVETDRENCKSIWYFKDDELLAVDAVNNAKAYMLGSKIIKNNTKIDKVKLQDNTIKMTPRSFLFL